MSENPYLTITLTLRPPVKIKKDEWPILAESAANDRHGAQIGNEANQEDDWFLRVRRHADGRAIVYAAYHYSTQWQDDHNLSVRAGELVASEEDLIRAIGRVSGDIASRVNTEGKPGDIFHRLYHECVADLPAVEMI